MIDIKTMPLTGFTKIDSDHKELALLFNKLYTLIDEDKRDDKNISMTLSDIISFTRKHFIHEEQLMDSLTYTKTLTHKAEHFRILNEMQLSIMNWREDKDFSQLKKDMLEKTPNWFLEHITKVDAPLVKFSKR